jgi:2-dehydro-3-deoxyphosphooctonate aldolase (KDO 8-P synthase)
MRERTVTLSAHPLKIGNRLPLALIAGPCVIETERMTLLIAGKLRSIARAAGLPFIFKASYDKANRSSLRSYRGPGITAGLAILDKVRKKYGVPVLTDVHSGDEARAAAKVVDMLQVPAFLCRQTDLLLACAATGLPVNVKKGQFLAPEDMGNIIEKIESRQNRLILLTERGTSFGYRNLVVDMRSIAVMKTTGYPVMFDATHAVQQPGGLGRSTGGCREFIRPLATAATALGIAGLFLEVHPDPSKALSDGPNSLSLRELPAFLKEIARLDRLVKERQ